ncbi:hypothetical protein FZ103_00850 [Streptomonospora sp. PA3]|uniref:DUF6292 family protein n=1 Tax=Streptomonospora sp. PA3 TaxID=2607326 RepID=UPI00130C4E6F|nr:hypothetical protein [Streptomonospora sp. PA3]
MTDNGPLPIPYSPQWVRLPEPYVDAVALRLAAEGVTVLDHWNDPMDPRDATVIVRGHDGGRLRFVWDEESGWRCGPLDAEGWTPLEATRYLPGGLLPDPAEVAATVRGVLAGQPAGAAERPRYRSFHDYGDGLDARLAAYAAVRAA